MCKASLQDSIPQLGDEPAALSLPRPRLYMYEFRGKTGFHAPFHRQAAGPGVKCSVQLQSPCDEANFT